jgi:hypothetical protein
MRLDDVRVAVVIYDRVVEVEGQEHAAPMRRHGGWRGAAVNGRRRGPHT